jgi:hypothetical protein
MSFLEQRLNSESFKEAARETGPESLSKYKFMIPYYYQYKDNIPKFRHSFQLWQEYVEMGIRNISNNSFLHCKNVCRKNIFNIGGANYVPHEKLFTDCYSDCASQWVGPLMSHIKVIYLIIVYY